MAGVPRAAPPRQRGPVPAGRGGGGVAVRGHAQGDRRDERDSGGARQAAGSKSHYAGPDGAGRGATPSAPVRGAVRRVGGSPKPAGDSASGAGPDQGLSGLEDRALSIGDWTRYAQEARGCVSTVQEALQTPW